MVSVGLIAGCGSKDNAAPDVPTVSPASAVPGPASPAKPPVGQVIATPAGGQAVVVDAAAHRVAVLSADGASVWFASMTNVTTPLSTVPTPRLSRLVAAPGGGLLGVGPRVLVRIAVDGGITTTATTIDEPSALAFIGNRVLVGTRTGHVIELDGTGKQIRDISGLVRVDDLAVAGHQVVALDRAQSSVTQLKLDDGDLGLSLRAGNGATTLIADHYGRFLVANTRDGEIIGFFGDPMVMRFRGPVADGPYGLAYDNKRNVLWVSVTGHNEVVRYDLASGEPIEQARFATVAQPDSISVDEATGTLYVASATGGGLAVVKP